VKVPVYNLATREDHIAPAKSVYLGSKFFGGPVRFVISGSGHIAGVVNPPARRNINIGPDQSRAAVISTNGWPRPGNTRGHGGRIGSNGSKATATPGVPARQPGKGKLRPIEDAPGSYVKVRD
jgi:polyhydroxyalkanoate synthase